jgi:hypothetical protein
VQVLLPGAAPVRKSRLGTAWATLFCCAFCGIVLSLQLFLPTSLPVAGPISWNNQIGLGAFPLPLSDAVASGSRDEINRWTRAHYRDFLAARPEVPLLWAAAAVSGLAGLALHLRALRRRDQTEIPSSPVSLEDAETAVSPGPRRGA